MKKLLLFIVAFCFGVSSVFAQTKQISGKVTSADDGAPIPGVSVVVKNSTTGTVTDVEGNFNLTVPENEVLVFSFVGMRTVEVPITETLVYNVELEAEAVGVEEVIVTAMGIQREKKALGYAVTEISNEQIEQRGQADIARVLSGKSSGVQVVQQSGLSGSGTNVIIRGLSSFSASNQALFVVDGVPFSSDYNSMGREGARSDFINGNNGSSRFLDLDPNSIESVSVLKGLAASTLYGSEGRNGVILITTKAGAAGKARKKTEITVTSSYFQNEIASLPDYQNEYGNGFDQAFGWFFSNWGPSFKEEGVAGWGNSAAIDENGTLPHPYSTSTAAIQAAFPEFQDARYEWKPYNNVQDFFRTGHIINSSVNIRGASDNGNISYNVNYSNLSDKGFTPGNKVNRNTLSVGGNAKLTNNFTVNGVMNFAKTDFVSPPVALSQGNGATGTGSSVFGDLWFTPRSIDLMGLPYQDPVTGGSVYYRQNNSIQHPLWTINNAGTQQITNRFYGKASLEYTFDEHLKIMYRVGIDVYNESNINYQNRGGVNTNSGDVRMLSGFYETWNNVNSIFDHNITVSGDYDITDDIGIAFNLGSTVKMEIFDQNGVASDNQQVYNVLRHFNFLNHLEIESFYERNIIGAYGQLEMDYGNFVYLTLAGRKDWVSNFSEENRSVLYPSASLSFLPTTVFEDIKTENGLNYLKLRVGYGTSANFGDMDYPVSNTLFLNTYDLQDGSGANIVTNTTGFILGNPDLKPELLQEFEVGMDAVMWKNRVALDLSLYKRTTKDLIINRPLDPASGYTTVRTNIGEIQNKGIEFNLGVDIIENTAADGFKWNTNLNFTAYETEVIDLGLNTDLVIYSGFNNLGNAAIEGEPLGIFHGGRILRHEETGEKIVGNDGLYVTDPQDGIIGDPNPDWISNLTNTFSFKNLALSFQFNYVHGGDVYSSTIATLLGRGLITETIDRENTYVLPGVDADGNKNTFQINNSDYYFSNVLFGPDELQVYDATTIRLQEVSLSYTLPSKLLSNTPLGAVSITASGYNLWYDAINTPDGARFDPNTSGLGVGNGFGFDYINGPSARRYGISAKITF
ncbi:MAG: SusC/RagA family TonB-linked outer membrane protein [Bacteroidota bacterium]